jgi:hypothetical protein
MDFSAEISIKKNREEFVYHHSLKFDSLLIRSGISNSTFLHMLLHSTQYYKHLYYIYPQHKVTTVCKMFIVLLVFIILGQLGFERAYFVS